MLKFTLNTSAFILLFFILILIWPVSKESMYKELQNDCVGYASWIYDRIYNNPAPVDIAFVGSSHTIFGIDDTLMDQQIHSSQVTNFGYCRPGRNLNYLMARDLIEEKRPEMIILEVQEFEKPFSHPIFPYMAETRDLLTMYPWFNPNWFSDLSIAVQYRLQLIQESIWNNKANYFYDARLHGRIAFSDTASVEVLNARIEENKSKFQPSESKLKFDHTFPHHYLEKIVKLCQESNIKLTFLYLPSYGSEEQFPYPLEYLETFAPVWIPPTSIWKNQDYWYDAGHLNQSGAIKLTEWVVGKINEQE